VRFDEPTGGAAQVLEVPAEPVELQLFSGDVAAGAARVAVDRSIIHRSRAGGASCTVSQSTSTGPDAVIMVLMGFGSRG
jgi:hypothetical protein